jgi:HD-like signal output (HDOD) protein/CheY-like chemotaxis protein
LLQKGGATMGETILFVDDERAILKTFQRSLRGSGFKIFIAQDGQAALEILACQNIDIIISDMRMPKMSGQELLRKVKELYPAAIRLILSGYAEEKEITKAMLEGLSKLYLLKPWDTEFLVKTIRQLLNVREVLQNRNLFMIINKMAGLRTLPHIYNKLTDMISQESDAQQIAEVIEEDPAIAARVLHIANSAFYDIKTGSVSQAIHYLGVPAVKNIALSTSLCDSLEDPGMRIFNKKLLWRHASITNKLVDKLYRNLIGETIPTTASTVGLLHNIGRIVLLDQFSDLYPQIEVALQERHDIFLDELECKFIGVSHQEVGGYLLEWWGLPYQIVECAMFHHDPLHESIHDKTLVSIVHIANYYASFEVCPGTQEFLDQRTFNLLQTTQEECERLIREE